MANAPPWDRQPRSQQQHQTFFFFFINKRASLPLFRYRLRELARSQNTPKQIQSPHSLAHSPTHTCTLRSQRTNTINKWIESVNRRLPFHHQNVAKTCVCTPPDNVDDGDNHDVELYRLHTFLLHVIHGKIALLETYSETSKKYVDG